VYAKFWLEDIKEMIFLVGTVVLKCILNFELWHPRCVLITVYKEWYQVVRINYLFSYMMEVAGNYMFRPLWWPSSGCT